LLAKDAGSAQKGRGGQKSGENERKKEEKEGRGREEQRMFEIISFELGRKLRKGGNQGTVFERRYS